MKIYNAQPESIADNEAFVSIITAATKSKEVRETIKTILNLPDEQRTILIQNLMVTMKQDSLPQDFIEAIEALADPVIADKIREALRL